ncbi:MAG: 4,5-DOPA dioxygenase extradiol [Candidatus Marinimicrobia bacterium]|nr:4,5-DOPA dioxygenase extradiol [Candidatus Neomarinimicrobiota bacterium]
MALPTLFIGHGSPMNAIEENSARRSWQSIAEQIPRPKSVLCISAHWETKGLCVTNSSTPETIHDFSGFPQALFDLQYPAPGNPTLACRISTLLDPEPVRLDDSRGLDHGAWSILMAMYPNANIPTVQLSLDMTKSPEIHYDLAKRLAPLRDEGVLVIGSGNIVHNLGVFLTHGHINFNWAKRFNEAAKRCIASKNHRELIKFEQLDSEAKLSVPTLEHFLPVLYPLALQRSEEFVSFFGDAEPKSFFMTSFIIGAAYKIKPKG